MPLGSSSFGENCEFARVDWLRLGGLPHGSGVEGLGIMATPARSYICADKGSRIGVEEGV